MHAGVNNTLTVVRQVYWIPTGRQYIQVLFCHCITCQKHSEKPYKALDMVPLPKVRLQDTPSFTVKGIDFTGHCTSDRTTPRQRPICLFTCVTTRMVHLETVTDLSVDTFLLAFSTHKSLSQVIMFDNAFTYLSVAEQLRNFILNSVKLEATMAWCGVVWKFIPKKVPWHEGCWERLIGLTN